MHGNSCEFNIVLTHASVFYIRFISEDLEGTRVFAHRAELSDRSGC